MIEDSYRHIVAGGLRRHAAGLLCHAAIAAAALVMLCLPNGCNNRNEAASELVFSSDTLMFDTVFTTTMSVTKSFTVTNPNRVPVTVDIALAGGRQSYYSMNVDGRAGCEFRGVVIPAQDSIFVFVKVLVNPVDQNTPYLVTDSIRFVTGSRPQYMQLVAYGQDAHFIVADHHGALNYKIVAGPHETAHWTSDKPWVIYGWAAVDSLGTLIVDPGTRVYVHKGGGIWIYRYGNIQVNGTAEEPVFFGGDRLEEFYKEDYAQWDRIWINEGTVDNVIDNAIITNASIGLQVSALNEMLGNRTIVSNSIIHNNGAVGVLGRAARIRMDNCQVSHNAQYSLCFQIGDYELNHVTVSNYLTQSPRSTPSVVLTNFYRDPTAVFVGDADLVCNNSIIDGYADNEFAVNKAKDAGLTYTLHNCIVKRDSLNGHFVNCLRNADPLLVDKYGQDCQLLPGSPAIGAGMEGLGITTDLLGRMRDDHPDIGAYEYYPAEDNKRCRRRH